MKQQSLLLIFSLCLVILVGVFAVQQYAFAQMSFGGKIVSYVPGPPGPCTYGLGVVISPPAPSFLPCIMWLAGPMPPVGAWVLGWGTPTAIMIGGWGF